MRLEFFLKVLKVKKGLLELQTHGTGRDRYRCKHHKKERFYHKVSPSKPFYIKASLFYIILYKGKIHSVTDKT